MILDAPGSAPGAGTGTDISTDISTGPDPDAEVPVVAVEIAPWQVFADAVLAGAALRFRLDRGEPPRDFAGVVVADDEIDHLIAELPGLRGLGRMLDGDTDGRLTRGREEAARSMHDSLHGSQTGSQNGETSASPDPTTESSTELLGSIVARLRLSRGATEVLAVLCSAELDLARQSLVAYLNDNASVRRLTLGVLARLFPGPHAGVMALGPDAPLVRSGLVSVDDGSWALRQVHLAPALAWMLAGDRSLDIGLPVGATLATGPGRTDGHRLVLVNGGDVVLRRQVAAAEAGGDRFLITPVPGDEVGWLAVVRYATLIGATVLVEMEPRQKWTPVGTGSIERNPHLAWVIASQHQLPIESLPASPHHEVDAALMVESVTRGSHLLGAEQAELADRTAAGRRGEWDAAVRRLVGGHLDELAVRLRPHRTWDDLVLTDEQMTQVREIVVRYRHASRVYRDWGFSAVPSSGITALFSGPSGTGKTMAAEVIAAELGLDLYRIDLSSVVSKWVGETEKNLERIFTAATAGNVVLFFDEADALFGKRSEVGDAHDRYANIEVSYLLQRLETYDGIVVLATNLRKNMDDAFLRRIDVAVAFTTPEPDQRRAIWEHSFPDGAPTHELDFDLLAERFDVAGGNIRNAALAAAFLAADDGTPIGMDHVVVGLQREFQKLGRLQNEFDEP